MFSVTYFPRCKHTYKKIPVFLGFFKKYVATLIGTPAHAIIQSSALVTLHIKYRGWGWEGEYDLHSADDLRASFQ